MVLSIKEIKPGDAEWQRMYYQPDMPEEQRRKRLQDDRWFERNAQHYIIAKVGKRLVGTVTFGSKHTFSQIKILCQEEEHKRTLLLIVEDEARYLGVKELHIYSPRTNVAFFENLGYKIISKSTKGMYRTAPSGSTIVHLPRHLMKKRLLPRY